MKNVTVIVDSNPLHDDPLWRKPSAGRLTALARRGLVRLVVPQVVLLELERQRRAVLTNKLEQLRVAPRKIETALSEIGMTDDEAGIQIPDVPRLTLDDLLKHYRQQVDRVIAETGIEVLPIPSVEHSELLARDLSVVKPFEQNGRGYRDALIWHSLKSFIEGLGDDDEVFFVTNDSNFRDGDSLDPALAEEIAEVPATVSCVRDLDELLEGPALEESNLLLQQALEHVPSVSTIAESAVEFAVGELGGETLGAEEREQLSVPDAVEDVEVESATPTGGFVWEAYDEFDGTTVLGKASIDAEVQLRGWVAKEDAAALADPDLHVQSWDNDVAEVHFEREGRAHFDLRVEVVAESVEDTTFLGFVE